MINRIDRVTGHAAGALDGFSWPTGLSDFARFNLIYGANGSGKTSVSRAFASAAADELEAGAGPDIRLVTDDDSKLIAVFNRDFVEENVLGPEGARHIVVLGKERVKEQEELEKLESELDASAFTLGELKKKRDATAGTLDKFKREKAKKIKEDLISIGVQAAGFDKAAFANVCESLNKLDEEPDYDVADLKKRSGESAKSRIEPLPITSLDFSALFEEVETLVATSVVKTATVELGSSRVSVWLEAGLDIHASESVCKFCTSIIPDGRLADLEAAFDTSFKSLVAALEEKRRDVVSTRGGLTSLELPSESDFYEDLKPRFRTARENFEDARTKAIRSLDAVIAQIDQKRSDMFGEAPAAPELDSYSPSLKEIDELIVENNELAASIDQRVDSARSDLRSAYVLRRIPRFNELSDAASTAKVEYDEHESKHADKLKAVKLLRESLLEPEEAANRINAALLEFLGHESIRLRPGETGYVIERGGEAADIGTLSEGETTALALIHFLQFLEHDGQKLENLVVVVDDPISSLDASTLFHAFGFIRSRTQAAHQLFLLTHNFEFFRLVRSWFIGKNDKQRTRARFFMTSCAGAPNARKVQLLDLDPVLLQYESEYHFLFGQLMDAQGEQDFEFFYTFPNTARRVLETFLSFKKPASAVSAGGLTLHDAIGAFDEDHAAEISKYLHAHSHEKSVTLGAGHDISNIEEAPTIAKRVLDFMRGVDPDHTEGMIKEINATREKVVAP